MSLSACTFASSFAPVVNTSNSLEEALHCNSVHVLTHALFACIFLGVYAVSTLFQLYHGYSKPMHDPFVNKPKVGLEMCLDQVRTRESLTLTTRPRRIPLANALSLPTLSKLSV